LSTLYIRMPSKAAADAVEHWLALPCPYALASAGDAVEREGVAALSELGTAIAGAQRVVLIVAASDVTLLRVKTPPLSLPKLRLVLPNLVEDQLMSDPDECVVVPGALADELRTAAVMQRGWLEIQLKTVTSLGARSVHAVPAQLCLPHREGSASAAICEQGGDIDITLRVSDQEGFGLSIMPGHVDEAVTDVLSSLRAMVPALPITLYVPQARVISYQQACGNSHGSGEFSTEPSLDADGKPTVSVFVDNWSHWIAGASKSAVNLLTGLGSAGGQQINWKQWRWPLVLATLLLVINSAALNFDWWRMKREATGLRTTMLQTFKTAFPKETVILDPLAQMHRKIDAAQRNSGEAAPDDFSQLAGNLAEVLQAEGGGSAAIASLEYKDRSLLLHLKSDSKLTLDKLQAALASRNLKISSPSNGVWQIRSGK
jgi:general secretion pathway protein L